jgi:hypothetical protein
MRHPPLRQGRVTTMDGSGLQLGRHCLTEEAYGVVEALWRHETAHIGLHEDA